MIVTCTCDRSDNTICTCQAGEHLDVFSCCHIDVLDIISAQMLSVWVVDEGDRKSFYRLHECFLLSGYLQVHVSIIQAT